MRSLATARFLWTHPLNRGGRLAALSRFLRWQLASRLVEGPIALPFIEDTRLLVTRGMHGATGNWYTGLHEVEEMAFLLHLLRRDDLFVDAGANVGSYTVLAAGGAGARVVAAEPVPETFRRLVANVRLNQLDERVDAHGIGLSESAGKLRFSRHLGTMNHVLSDKEEVPSVEIEVSTLDELLDGQAPLAVKIDVEGHELPLLRGGARTLSSPRLCAVILEVNGAGGRYGVEDATLLDTMRRYGFESLRYDPFRRILRSGASAGGNVLFVRNREDVETRVRDARRFRLVNGAI